MFVVPATVKHLPHARVGSAYCALRTGTVKGPTDGKSSKQVSKRERPILVEMRLRGNLCRPTCPRGWAGDSLECRACLPQNCLWGPDGQKGGEGELDPAATTNALRVCAPSPGVPSHTQTLRPM